MVETLGYSWVFAGLAASGLWERITPKWQTGHSLPPPPGCDALPGLTERSGFLQLANRSIFTLPFQARRHPLIPPALQFGPRLKQFVEEAWGCRLAQLCDTLVPLHFTWTKGACQTVV